MKAFLFILAVLFHIFLVTISTRNAAYGLEFASPEKQVVCKDTSRVPVQMMDLSEFSKD